MASVEHLPGIESRTVATERIRTHLLTRGPRGGVPVVFLHGNLSSAAWFEELMLALPSSYTCYAPDLRGYGETEDLPIDATRGARDMADDLRALLAELQIDAAHLAGWSAGAAAAMQFTIDQPSAVASLTLVAPVSPYGFGGTRDVDGTPTTPDFAGSGAGTVNAQAVEQLRSGQVASDSPLSPLQLLRTVYVKPPARLAREETLVRTMFRQKLGERRYPGDFVRSPYWPHVAPGAWGPINALSPKYFNASAIADVGHKPPILWIRGDADRIVSDHSLFDVAAAASQSNADFPPQPMVAQMREVLRRYAANGGRVEEVSMKDTGHSPFLERPKEFLQFFRNFLRTGVAL
jgi:pimeloyl-ACP methyl ester carboxylesterase